MVVSFVGPSGRCRFLLCLRFGPARAEEREYRGDRGERPDRDERRAEGFPAPPSESRGEKQPDARAEGGPCPDDEAEFRVRKVESSHGASASLAPMARPGGWSEDKQFARQPGGPGGGAAGYFA